MPTPPRRQTRYVTAREFHKLEKRLGAIEQAILELAEALRRPDAPPGGVVLPSTPREDASGRQNAAWRHRTPKWLRRRAYTESDA